MLKAEPPRQAEGLGMTPSMARRSSGHQGAKCGVEVFGAAGYRRLAPRRSSSASTSSCRQTAIGLSPGDLKRGGLAERANCQHPDVPGSLTSDETDTRSTRCVSPGHRRARMCAPDTRSDDGMIDRVDACLGDTRTPCVPGDTRTPCVPGGHADTWRAGGHSPCPWTRRARPRMPGEVSVSGQTSGATRGRGGLIDTTVTYRSASASSSVACPSTPPMARVESVPHATANASVSASGRPASKPQM